MRDTSIDFNKTAELRLEKKMERYGLNQEEKSEVWMILNEKNDSLRELEAKHDKEWNKMYNEQYNELKSKQRPQLAYEYGRTNLNESQIIGQAKDNVRRITAEAKVYLEQQADQRIQQVFDKAKQENRGQGLNYQNENQRNNSRDR